jgi:hypothetical protein
LPKVFERDHAVFKHSFSLLLPINVNDIVLCSGLPSVNAPTVLLAILPHSIELLSARIIEYADSMTLIVLEFTLIQLPILPVELALAILLAATPLAFVH